MGQCAKREMIGEVEIHRVYRHFKGDLYIVEGVAEHTETGEEMVFYRALYGEGKLYARPLEMFVSEVDHEKYPDVKQKYRFEKIEAPISQMTIEERMMKFFDEDTLEGKYQVLLTMRNELTDTMIDNMAVVLDLVIEDGPIEKRFDDLKFAIQTKQRYEQTNRLR